ncbi:PREDICTED: guanine nucleotide exchange factor subunit Rich [Ceratosolen solmsi marchali]|uniref:Protein RIC1 homolog n=1 Tax=Ceratosolen solmsi marchali TaxID=326594 RepID=A0AAJ6YTA1_9HYME|nr:PREDICTED: guanine nucleotide exchange factor subunit Rich [Ceratosolen solmsi marchali]
MELQCLNEITISRWFKPEESSTVELQMDRFKHNGDTYPEHQTQLTAHPEDLTPNNSRITLYGGQAQHGHQLQTLGQCNLLTEMTNAIKKLAQMFVACLKGKRPLANQLTHTEIDLARTQWIRLTKNIFLCQELRAMQTTGLPSSHAFFRLTAYIDAHGIIRSHNGHIYLQGTKQWLIVPIPNAYTSSNWPIRFTAIDEEGESIAVAGKTGLAHYSMLSRKWKLFGNEYQERDFVVTGGLLWYHGYLITSSYSIPENEDELRLYPRNVRLDNNYVKSIKMTSQILLLNIFKNLLLVFCANSQIRIYNMILSEETEYNWIELVMIQTIDISNLCAHPACVVNASLTLIRTEISKTNTYPETLLLNISGKLLMIQRDHWLESTDILFTCASPTILASSVENLWVSTESIKNKPHLMETVWLFCGTYGMRVWLPLFPKTHQDKIHTFMSKRIMLPFQLKIYPLTILFDDAILLGAENDTVLYTSDTSSPILLPFSILELTSQVYLHQIIRQLIHRNLGYHAWEIARSCSSLPYFSHSLELLLHEVLEEEATSKEPIPDALLPSVIEFIKEFPGYWAQAVVQCARKTEIALWPYLFSVVGPPKKLLQTSLNNQELDTAASYLLILQNLEASSISKQYATLLLDAALEQGRWDLSKDLVRFLRAIDPNDVDSLKTSTTVISKKSQNSTFSSQEDDLTLVLGTMQVSRNRSYSTTATPKLNSDSFNKDTLISSLVVDKNKNIYFNRKKSVPMICKNDKSGNSNSSAEDFFIDVILQRHARKLLTSQRLLDLGCFAAQLDFELVIWMIRERERAGKVDNYITALKAVHDQFGYPYPLLTLHDFIKLKTSAKNIQQQVDLIIHDDFQKNINDEVCDIEHIDSKYQSFPIDKDIYTYSTSNMNNINIPYSQSLIFENNKTRSANDSSSIICDFNTLIWEDDTLTTMENHIARTCASSNSIQTTDVSSYFFNEYGSRAEVQLRYLLQVFLEAGCLGWAVIIAIVLRDIAAVNRAIRAASVSTQTTESIINLKEGLTQLINWSYSEWI